MTGIALLLVVMAVMVVPLPGAAQPSEPTLQQKAAIVTHITHAQHLIDDSHPENNPEYGWAFRLKTKLEIEMGLRGRGGEPLRSDMRPTAEDLKKISGGWFGHDQRGDYARALRGVQEAREAAKMEYQTALNDTMEAYHIHDIGGVATNGPPWEVGRYVLASPDLDDWTGGERREDEPGYISTDGHVFIRLSAFFNHADVPTFEEAPEGSETHGDPDPGYLASILYHESLHIEDSLSPPDSRSLRNVPATEFAHRLKQLGLESVFQLPSHDFVADLKNLAWQNDLEKMWDDAMRLGHDPYNPTDRQLIFNQLAISDQRQRQISDQVNRDAQNLMSTTNEEDPASLERLREHAESDFFRRLDDSQLHDLVAGWKESRRVDADRAERNRQLFLARMAQEIQRCGFAMHNYDQGAFNGTFMVDGRWSFDYRVKQPLFEEQFVAGLMIAATCISMTRDGHFALPCNAGLDVLSSHASDPSFKAPITFDTSPDQKRCIETIRDKIQPPVTLKEYTDIAFQAWDDYRKTQRERQRQDERDRQNPSNGPNSDGDRRGTERPDRSQPSEPGYRHPPTPGKCWFDSAGAHCD